MIDKNINSCLVMKLVNYKDENTGDKTFHNCRRHQKSYLNLIKPRRMTKKKHCTLISWDCKANIR